MLLGELTNLFEFLGSHSREHSRESTFYRFLDPIFRAAFREAKDDCVASRPIPLGEIGSVIMPYKKMGAVDSLDLFGLDELLLFAFYHRNRSRYKHAVDIGANLGLHTIILAKCGFTVLAYEPDPVHYEKLLENLKLNGVADKCDPQCAAISDSAGNMEFVRVLGNTTSSHIAGAKSNPYGELERFPVAVHDIRAINANIDLAKIDAEGHENTILRAISFERWRSLDAFVEIGTPQNAELVFDHFKTSKINIFAQKSGWQKIASASEMPQSYREGSIFLTAQDTMHW